MLILPIRVRYLHKLIMCVLPERQVNSAYFAYFIVIQVSVWQHRHSPPSVSLATAPPALGLQRFSALLLPPSIAPGPSLPAARAGLPRRAPAPSPSTARGVLASLLHPPASLPAAEPAPGRPWAPTSQRRPRIETEGRLL